MNSLIIALTNTAFVAVAFFWIWIASLLANRFEKSSFDANREVELKNNLALGLRRGGLYLGTGIGMLGPLYGNGSSFWHELGFMFWEGAVVTVFMLVCGWLNDRFILHQVNNTKVVAKNNVAVGLTEAGGYVATGLIAFASFAGESGGLAVAFVFFALGQLTLIVCTRIYERFAGYDVTQEICDDNRSAGIMLAAVLVSLGTILKSSIIGPFTSWTYDIGGFALYALFGMLVLIIVEKLADLVFLPHTRISGLVREKNTAGVTVTAGIMLAMAILISVAVV